MFSLDKSILSTIVYYDVLGLPLTSLEVYKYLVDVRSPTSHISFSDISDALESNDFLKKYLDHKNGFYFLKCRNDIVEQRIRGEKAIQEKWKKCKWAIKLLGGVPFVRMAALSGSVAVGNASEVSDIDLLVVVKKGRIWTTRLLVTILLSILGKRRYGRFIKDRICLNHYITDKSLKINFPSLYNAQTYVHLIPVLGDTDLFVRFQKENSWIKGWVSPGDNREKNLKYLKPSLLLKVIVGPGELVLSGRWGDFVEKILARWQKKIINRGTDASGRGRITIDDTQLEFHPDSPEAWIVDKYNKKMRDLGFQELAKERDSGLHNY